MKEATQMKKKKNNHHYQNNSTLKLFQTDKGWLKYCFAQKSYNLYMDDIFKGNCLNIGLNQDHSLSHSKLSNSSMKADQDLNS